MVEQKHTDVWRDWAIRATVTTVVLGLLAIIWGNTHRRITVIENTLDTHSVGISTTATRIEDHKTEAAIYIRTIRGNAEAVSTLQRAMAGKRVKVAELQGKYTLLQQQLRELATSGGTAKRFTSDNARELKDDFLDRIKQCNAQAQNHAERLRELERRCDKVEQ